MGSCRADLPAQSMDRLRRAVIWTAAAAATAALIGASSAAPGDERADSPATLSGFVRDRSDGERLPNATVAVGDRQMGTLSNAEGYYALPGIPAGTWVIAVSYIGYAVHRDTLHLAAGRELRLDIELDRDELEMEAVVVEAEGGPGGKRAEPADQRRRPADEVPAEDARHGGTRPAAQPAAAAGRPDRFGFQQRPLRARRRTGPDRHPARPGAALQPVPRLRLLLHLQPGCHQGRHLLQGGLPGPVRRQSRGRSRRAEPRRQPPPFQQPRRRQPDLQPLHERGAARPGLVDGGRGRRTYIDPALRAVRRSVDDLDTAWATGSTTSTPRSTPS